MKLCSPSPGTRAQRTQELQQLPARARPGPKALPGVLDQRHRPRIRPAPLPALDPPPQPVPGMDTA